MRVFLGLTLFLFGQYAFSAGNLGCFSQVGESHYNTCYASPSIGGYQADQGSGGPGCYRWPGQFTMECKSTPYPPNSPITYPTYPVIGGYIGACEVTDQNNSNSFNCHRENYIKDPQTPVVMVEDGKYIEWPAFLRKDYYVMPEVPSMARVGDRSNNVWNQARTFTSEKSKSFDLDGKVKDSFKNLRENLSF